MKFFRKNRQQWLTGNKLSKYLLYAIGEIMLVVIGILIALYLNELKERNNDMLLEKYYSHSIRVDLEQDQVLISKVIGTIQSHLENIDNYTSRIYSQSATIDTIIKIARYEFQTEGAMITYNDNSLKSLISTGNLNLFETNFSELLLDLDKTHKKENDNSKVNSSMYYERLNVYQLKYTKPYEDLPENNLIDNILWKEVDEKDFVSKFRSLLFMKRYKDRALLKNLKSIKKKTTFLIDYIKNNHGV